MYTVPINVIITVVLGLFLETLNVRKFVFNSSTIGYLSGYEYSVITTSEARDRRGHYNGLLLRQRRCVLFAHVLLPTSSSKAGLLSASN